MRAAVVPCKQRSLSTRAINSMYLIEIWCCTGNCHLDNCSIESEAARAARRSASWPAHSDPHEHEMLRLNSRCTHRRELAVERAAHGQRAVKAVGLIAVTMMAVLSPGLRISQRSHDPSYSKLVMTVIVSGPFASVAVLLELAGCVRESRGLRCMEFACLAARPRSLRGRTRSALRAQQLATEAAQCVAYFTVRLQSACRHCRDHCHSRSDEASCLLPLHGRNASPPRAGLAPVYCARVSLTSAGAA